MLSVNVRSSRIPCATAAFDGARTPISLRSLADAIRAEQDILKTSKAKLPAWGLPLLFLGHEQMALITIGTLFNMIARSEFETCLSPGITSVASEIGQL